SYLFGFTDVTILSREGRTMFLLGKRYAEGKWFYFPAAFLIKSTIGLLALLALLPFARALRQIQLRREAVYLLLPPAIFLAAAMTSKLNIGIRHILPVMPFLIVLAAGGAVALARQSRRWAWAIAVLVALHAASSLHAYPNYLPYSNEAFGGVNGTWRVLEDSNVGWGGGLKALRAEIASRNITQCWFAYAAPPNPANFQIPCKRLPSFFSAVSDQGQQQPVPEHIDGPIFISSEELNGSFWGIGDSVPYHSLQTHEPSRVIAGEILEFDGSFDLPKVSAISEWVYATGLLRHGKLDQAIAEAQRATQLDPSSIYARETLYTAYAIAHKFDDAEREYHAALAIYQGLSADDKKAVFAPPVDPLAKH
ncbi:MAG: tetratricopeptide repeat protein, partial [Terracidiphilus sp.]